MDLKVMWYLDTTGRCGIKVVARSVTITFYVHWKGAGD